ncbi:MAG: hypothetical protein HFJ30_02590 [Clostridia bacterium]|nr:hypothetical protein [Clostridia bacterium]
MVLLILAGITITYVMGDNSIFKLAQDAKDKTEQAKNDERDYFNNLDNTINQYINGNGGGSNPSGKVDVSTITDKVDKNTSAEDSLGNPITIPEGFKVVPDGQDGVEYTYTGDKKPTVQDGIVIEDGEGNQFVWIPVGEIKNKDGSTTTITLGRYTFNSTNGTPTLQQNADNYTEVVTIESCFQELETSSYENIVAKSLSIFVSKTKANGGYYLARYEASYKDDTHCYSKVSTSTRSSSSTTLTSGMLWNYITQPEAAEIARNMYTSTNFESDLVNSYAWDTAIVFIQTYSEYNDYSKQNSKNTTLANTGVNNDKVCNIYDMASNTCEWTTETFAFAVTPWTGRGGTYFSSYYYTAIRCERDTSYGYDDYSFRSLLYVK